MSPPYGMRRTSGSGTRVRQWYLAAMFTTWVNASVTKSANCISTTGRIPITAAPMPAPTLAVSASGASMTRHGPNSSRNPSVILNAPPYTPMSSPNTKTRGSRRISSRSPSRIASR
jgi:hypothetical protein